MLLPKDGLTSLIGWTNFLCGRWGVKWKEAQQRHYLGMKSRKLARLWVIAIIKKLLLLQWDMWQFRNTALHSPTGATVITSHHSLNYKIDEEICQGTDGIDCSNYCLFSPLNTLTKLQSSSIHDKEQWRNEVSMANKEYVDPGDEVTRQATSQRNQMQAFLITDGPFIPIPPRERLVAIYPISTGGVTIARFAGGPKKLIAVTCCSLSVIRLF